MFIEVAVYVVVLIGGLLPLAVRVRHSRLSLVSTAVGLLLLGGIGLAWWRRGGSLPPTERRPLQVREGSVSSERGFVSSNACRSCHPQQYATWYGSFHRTMTQVVTPETVIADFNNVELDHASPGLPDSRYVLQRRGDEFWVQLPQPEFQSYPRPAGGPNPEEEAPPVWRQIVMSTGLHHYQLYWYPSGSGRELYMVPFVFLTDERRWVPRRSVFLTPPNAPEPQQVWNTSCLPCHTTDGHPRYPKKRIQVAKAAPDTHVVEVGIACEACHGQGEEHVRVNRNPLRRYAYHHGNQPDQTIVQPKRVDARTSSQICGQCHSVNNPYTRVDVVEWLTEGPRYRAGDDLEESRYVLSRRILSQTPAPETLQQLLEARPSALNQWFWADGMIRVTGREYSGLIESPCYRGGEFSCLSCHSMHESDPDDQLAAGMEGDQACLQCHDSYSSGVMEHTHHRVESSGSRCYNCHMAHTTYGLLKASRSHTIDSPSVAASVQTGRPNACNSCHLDKTLHWTATYLRRWYGAPAIELPEEERTIATSLLWLLRGDAGQRALTAWSMGWEAAHRASGKSWLAPFLAQTLNDPYDVVRYISARSLRRLPGYGDFSYDFVGPPEDRAHAKERALDIWRENGRRNLDRIGSEILIGPDGALRRQQIDSLLRRRDDRPMGLAE